MLVAQAFVRSIHYISIVGLAALCVGPVVLRLGPRLGFARLERILAGVAAISWCALLVFTVLGWNDGNWQSLADPGTWRAVLETSYGRTWCERFALLVACIFLCPIAKLGWIRVGLAELACVSMAITGHASADPRGIGSLHIGIDAVHLFSATLWPGGLLFLFFLLLPDRIPIFELPRVVSRFSTMSLIAAGALLVTGIGNVALTVEHWDLGEAYLWTLAIKLVVVAALMSVGSVNLLRHRPALAHVTNDLTRDQGRNAIRQLVAWECLLAVLVFVATGFLTLLPP